MILIIIKINQRINKMKKEVIISVIVILIFSSVLGYLYFFHRPQNNYSEEDKLELNIAFAFKDDLISTGYSLNGIEGITSKKGYTQKVVWKNKTNKLYNVNLENQNYYRDYSEFKMFENMRKNIELKKPYEVFVEEEVIKDNQTINLKLKSKYYRNPVICVSWTLSYLTVKNTEIGKTMDLYKEIEEYEDKIKSLDNKKDDYESSLKFYEDKIESLKKEISNRIDYFENDNKKYDKCYILNQNLDDNKEVSLNFDYEIYSEINKYDKIEFLIMDSDYIENKWITEYDNKDIGGNNKIIEIS